MTTNGPHFSNKQAPPPRTSGDNIDGFINSTANEYRDSNGQQLHGRLSAISRVAEHRFPNLTTDNGSQVTTTTAQSEASPNITIAINGSYNLTQNDVRDSQEPSSTGLQPRRRHAASSNRTVGGFYNLTQDEIRDSQIIPTAGRRTRRRFGPNRRVEVAKIRKVGACKVCRKRKVACDPSHRVKINVEVNNNPQSSPNMVVEGQEQTQHLQFYGGASPTTLSEAGYSFCSSTSVDNAMHRLGLESQDAPVQDYDSKAQTSQGQRHRVVSTPPQFSFRNHNDATQAVQRQQPLMAGQYGHSNMGDQMEIWDRMYSDYNAVNDSQMLIPRNQPRQYEHQFTANLSSNTSTFTPTHSGPARLHTHHLEIPTGSTFYTPSTSNASNGMHRRRRQGSFLTVPDLRNTYTPSQSLSFSQGVSSHSAGNMPGDTASHGDDVIVRDHQSNTGLHMPVSPEVALLGLLQPSGYSATTNCHIINTVQPLRTHESIAADTMPASPSIYNWLSDGGFNASIAADPWNSQDVTLMNMQSVRYTTFGAATEPQADSNLTPFFYGVGIDREMSNSVDGDHESI